MSLQDVFPVKRVKQEVVMMVEGGKKKKRRRRRRKRKRRKAEKNPSPGAFAFLFEGYGEK